MQRWIELAGSGSLGPSKSLADGSILFERGDRVDAAYFLETGAIEILQRATTGTSMVVKILVAPSLFGNIEVLAREREYLETVRACGPSKVRRVGVDNFRELVRRDAAASFGCLVDTAAAFCVAARFEMARLADTETLLANLFVAYADVLGEGGTDGVVRLGTKRTQAQLADAVGAGERSVNRILARWKKRGWVDKKAARYLITNMDELREKATDLEGSLLHGLPNS